MANGDKIANAILEALTEISKKEKEKAVQSENYAGVIVASIFEGLFQELKS